MTICHLPPRTLIGEVDKIDVGIKTPHLWGRTPGINALPIMLVSVLPPFSLRFLFVAVSTFGRLMGWIRAVRRLLIYFVTQPPHSPDSYRIVVDKAKWAIFTPVWVKFFFFVFECRVCYRNFNSASLVSLSWNIMKYLISRVIEEINKRKKSGKCFTINPGAIRMVLICYSLIAIWRCSSAPRNEFFISFI